MPTIAEKILSRAAGRVVHPGDIVIVQADAAVVMDYFAAQLLNEVIEVGAENVWDPEKVVLVMDHRVPAVNVPFAEKQKVMREFSRSYGIKHIYDIGNGGISHRLTSEIGIARPGIFYAADDTHAPTLGAFGCYATCFLYDMTEILATGKTWYRVPSTIKINLTGSLKPGVMTRDAIQKIMGDLGSGSGLGHVIEFGGSGVKTLSMESRMALCNLVPHIGAETAIIPPDELTFAYMRDHNSLPYEPLYSDGDAKFSAVYDYDLGTIEPMAALPGNPLDSVKLNDVLGRKFDQGYLGSCANGGFEDLEIAARILKDKTISPDCRMIVVPATQAVYREALKKGIISILSNAGAVICPPGCGACPGSHMGIIAAGEVCLTTSTLNTNGRMGSAEAQIYSVSPATVAASCLEGEIADPRRYV